MITKWMHLLTSASKLVLQTVRPDGAKGPTSIPTNAIKARIETASKGLPGDSKIVSEAKVADSGYGPQIATAAFGVATGVAGITFQIIVDSDQLLVENAKELDGVELTDKTEISGYNTLNEVYDNIQTFCHDHKITKSQFHAYHQLPSGKGYNPETVGSIQDLLKACKKDDINDYLKQRLLRERIVTNIYNYHKGDFTSPVPDGSKKPFGSTMMQYHLYQHNAGWYNYPKRGTFINAAQDLDYEGMLIGDTNQPLTVTHPELVGILKNISNE